MEFNLKKIASQKGKIAIVTGANTGLGKEITIGLAKKDIKVIMACRNLVKAEAAKTEILKAVPTAELELMELDLSSLKSVRTFATAFKNKYQHLNLLIENAGIMIPEYTKTVDGFESQMGVNYFGHFLLTNLIFPLLNNTEGSRIITTSSIAHESGRIGFDNINWEKNYSKMEAYRQSKLACLMFAYELHRKIDEANSKVIAISAHPGVSKTNLFNNLPLFLQIISTPFIPLLTHPPKRAALPMLYAALGEDIKGGDYIGPIGYKGMKGAPGKVKSEPHSYDKAVAKKLWLASEELTKEKFTL